MKRNILAALLVALCAPFAFAQEDAPLPENWTENEVQFGVIQTDVDTISSKFLEYRDIPDGLVAPFFRFRGVNDGLRWDVSAIDLGQGDQAFAAFLGKGKWTLEGDYNRIPHSFGNGGKTLLTKTGDGVWQLSDTTQAYYQGVLESTNPRSRITYPFLADLVAPAYAAAGLVDLKLTRERGNIAFTMKPGDAEVRVSYFRERRVGDRAASGTAFGFGNVVELPEPVHYLTQDFGVDLFLTQDWGSLRGGVHYNKFDNRIDTLAFDNPFRVTDSSDSGAYQAPGSSSVAGGRYGLVALPPTNEAFTGTLGFTAKFNDKTRLVVDGSYGTWTQNEPFIPYTTNTAVKGAVNNLTSTSSLPAQSLDGQVDVTSLNAFFSARPADKLTFIARLRYYDLDNGTPQISFPGYVRYDGYWNAVPRISVPYGYKNTRMEVLVAYDFGKLNLEGGLRHALMDRTFRETEETKETAVFVNAALRASDQVRFRGGFERAMRDYEGVEMELSEEASFVLHGTPTNALAMGPGTAAYVSMCGTGPICNLRYDQAKKDADRYNASVEITPTSGKVTFVLGYWGAKDDYKDSIYGLTEAKFNTFSADLDFTPNDKATLYGFFSYELIEDSQRGRQSAATVSTNPADDWTSEVEDKVTTLGGGADFTLKPEKWFLNVTARYQKVDGSNAIAVFAGGAPATARSATGAQGFDDYDDTEIVTLIAELKHQLAAAWTVTLGGMFEDYSIADALTGGSTNFYPASFFLNANDGNYQAKVGYFRVAYRF